MDSNGANNNNREVNEQNPDESNDKFSMKDCKDALPNGEDKANASKNGSDEEYSDAKDDTDEESDEELDFDEESIANSHKDLSEDELKRLRQDSLNLKSMGNDCFKKAEYKESANLYTQALNTCPLKFQNDRSILYANRAAARIVLEKKEEAVLDCNKAIELNPNYVKALLRRAQLHKKMENLEKALEDYQKILELDRSNAEARQECTTLPAEIKEKNEKMKEEMFGKLKELGNICLKPFGLSTENFKVVQDPNTGGYSINFQNNT
ncbi:tetratricopeptide repeat protein 1 [Caerostris darwini]|uniref:Tetratricopeptide repeat protein 1 n=1 Tax=Caerostris darwini TaxID=1538125 RepID=A0AAV4WMC3_9ARAC|nr:tetratricopeptide repeat protein 1 [Caerostris darwini]